MTRDETTTHAHLISALLNAYCENAPGGQRLGYTVFLYPVDNQEGAISQAGIVSNCPAEDFEPIVMAYFTSQAKGETKQ